MIISTACKRELPEFKLLMQKMDDLLNADAQRRENYYVGRGGRNQEYTFVINGDCSKTGWETSKRFHEARMKWCEKHKHDVENIIVINFGEGDDPCCIVFDSSVEGEGKE